MTMLYEGAFAHTLETLLDTYANPAHAGCLLEVWTFDPPQQRHATEAAFRKAGVTARLRSAYKPLLHFFLEREDRDALRSVTIRYPVHDGQPDRRFLLETYPLAALIGNAELRFEEGERNALDYDVTLTGRDGEVSRHEVFAPNRSFTDHLGNEQLSPAGWLRLTRDGKTVLDRPLRTDCEALFRTAVDVVEAHPWSDREPYFETLTVTVGLPGEETPLAHGEEVVSLHEALHEDIYFSLLEVFQKKSGRAAGDRSAQPGQIIPVVLAGAAAPFLRIETGCFDDRESEVPEQRDLAKAGEPLGADQIRTAAAALGGEMFSACSRAGRLVAASHRKGRDPAVMISAGQHANETTGIVGALRAAQVLAKSPDSHFILSPLENPDGYELHHRLRRSHPRHMHHAARYTALGDDLEYREREPLFEKAVRLEGAARSGAKLHINLHGYPSHEWTRPFSGYVPRGFAMWTIPKGFFLILRHHASWEEQGRQLIGEVTKRLMAIPDLVAFNRRQIDLYAIHAGEAGFEMINGFPCLIEKAETNEMPVTLITEYPDETVYGEAFIAGHDVQMATVLAAYAAWREIASSPATASAQAAIDRKYS